MFIRVTSKRILALKNIKTNLLEIVSPVKSDKNLWIYQDAWFHLGSFDSGFEIEYQIKMPGNGVYAFLIEGDVTIENQSLNKRDGMGLWEVDKITIKSNSHSELLLIEVPMELE